MKIPPDAFTRYAALGPGRSYEVLAQSLHVSKRSITRRARREEWQVKLREFDAGVSAEATSRLHEDMAAIRERHLRATRALQAKALEALRAKPIGSAADAARVLLLAQKEEERLASAASPARVEVSIEHGVRESYERRTVAVEGTPAAMGIANGKNEDEMKQFDPSPNP